MRYLLVSGNRVVKVIHASSAKSALSRCSPLTVKAVWKGVYHLARVVI